LFRLTLPCKDARGRQAVRLNFRMW
jgi:hypothetical protein